MPDDAEDLRHLLYEVLEQRIARRAYEIYQARAGAPGSALDDWLQAEMEVLGQSISAPLYSRKARAARARRSYGQSD